VSDWRFGRNWLPWMFPYGQSGLAPPANPYAHTDVWIMRDGWEEPQQVNPQKLDPLMNVADLYWTTEPPLNRTFQRRLVR
jgi:hypothetical protein